MTSASYCRVGTRPGVGLPPNASPTFLFLLPPTTAEAQHKIKMYFMVALSPFCGIAWAVPGVHSVPAFTVVAAIP